MGNDAVYRGMSQRELDRQYDARATVDDITPFLDQYAALTTTAKKELEVLVDVPFGPRPDEVLDIYPAGANAPVFVFIHGGYWRLLSKDESAFFARCFVEQGIAVAAVNYSLAPMVSLDEITRQVRSAIAHVWHDADRYGLDRSRIHVGGTSAGGHLVGMVLAGGWRSRFGLPDTAIAGALAINGLFDLEPVRLSFPNEWVKLDAAAAHRNSPIHHLPEIGCPLLVSWAGLDTDEFKRQSRDYARAWQEAGFPVSCFEISDRNHFDIILDLADPGRELTRQVFDLIDEAMN
ncbi:MAG: alpha/beta hydrolase [Alphaproteobacteria bacterium]|nr:alpha/beta hydrolase [Alphaproteobacteria bacterium]